jgi:subtilisin family serine protease
MRRALLIPFALLMLMPGAVAYAAADLGRPSSSQQRFVPGEVLVRFDGDAGPAARSAALRGSGVRSSGTLPAPGLRSMRLRDGVSVGSAVASLSRQPGVLHAQPNHYYRLAAVPNDPRLPELWGLNNSGQAVQGRTGAPDADIDAPEAWNITKGSPRVAVAVTDSGVAYDHPDLKPNLWHNPGESGRGRETNGRDDDHNGLVDDWQGWDFAAGDNDPRDLESHGSHVAGIIGARGNNGTGTTGVNWQVGLMALRVADASGLVTDKAIVQAFDYAARQGARVVNASFVSPSDSPVLRDAVRRHPKTLFVAAAGNGGDDGIGDSNDTAPQYPCNYALVNLVCVAASDQFDRLTEFSNFGRSTVDLAAPGSSVLSAAPAYGPPAFSDGFETELAGIWTTGGQNDGWARITTVTHSGSYSLSDSPGTTYLNDTNSFVRTTNPVNLSGQAGCRLSYALRLTTEPGVDRLAIEVSRDGATWTSISDASGSSGGLFLELTDDLTSFDGAPLLYIRFRLETNGSVVADGAQLDDVAVRCLGSIYSGAEFVYNDGTSMAAPHVSGVAGLIWARYPRLGVQAVRKALLRGVDRIAALSGKLASGGRLNAYRSLREARKLLPKLKLSSASRQRAARDGRLSLYARCKSRCAVVATGKVSTSGARRAYRLKGAARALRGGKRKKLVLRLNRRTRAGVKKALARGRSVTARVTVTATDRRGSTASAKRTIRIRR